MKLIKKIIFILVMIFAGVITVKAQLYKINLDQKINKASLVVEGKVIDQHSFWNDAHTVIYTSNTIHVYKLFKGKIISGNIEVVTLGGTVEDKCLIVSDVLSLRKNETGMFFLNENADGLHSPVTKRLLYDVYSSRQGFLKYARDKQNAFAPFAKYDNQTLYQLIQQQTGVKEQIIDSDKTGSSSPIVEGGQVSNGTTAIAITSFSPASVHAGAINDDANNILTINGSGFGDTPSDAAAVEFKDANSDNLVPDYDVDYTSPYIISWSNSKIVLHVPDRAATGKIAVVANDGTVATSTTELNVFYAVLDALFNQTVGVDVIKEPRLMNTNGSGGYTIQYSTNTAGGGKDFSTSPAKATFERALATWKEVAGANFIVGATTTIQKVEDDRVNIIMYDNKNTGVPKMADGVLESTYSWFSACKVGNVIQVAQKTGFDIIIRNDNVSTGTKVTFEEGPCFPAEGTYDLEMIILHELGHALNLAHINDDYEDGGNSYQSINPSKLMHYSILDYVDRRSPDASAYQAALYEITPQHNTYGSCGLFTSEMTPLSAITISNDECPSTFPSTQIADNTTVSIDLIHATSNKLTDPSFKQVTCNNNGTSITNNAYYAFTTGSETVVTLDIKNFTLLPSDLASCTGEGVRLALYDVQSCPEGQNYPQPVTCASFAANGALELKNLQANHKYLLYFDGIRNTKASFNVVFNSDSSLIPDNNTIEVITSPNPVEGGILNVQLNNISNAAVNYQYVLYDAVGKQIATGKITLTQPTTRFQVQMKNKSHGIYFLRVIDDKGNKISIKKILNL
ncbi:MAG: T9SS type A sorting domain-containing protein [Bacteroidetes bacterium]|nr:T9SS type A sorting domain-containing protein [Bacteroidota bacterium]